MQPNTTKLTSAKLVTDESERKMVGRNFKRPYKICSKRGVSYRASVARETPRLETLYELKILLFKSKAPLNAYLCLSRI